MTVGNAWHEYLDLDLRWPLLPQGIAGSSTKRRECQEILDLHYSLIYQVSVMKVIGSVVCACTYCQRQSYRYYGRKWVRYAAIAGVDVAPTLAWWTQDLEETLSDIIQPAEKWQTWILQSEDSKISGQEQNHQIERYLSFSFLRPPA